MKFAPLAALLLVTAAASPALADAHMEAAEATTATFTLNTPIETLMADENAKAVVLATLPGLDEHPAYGQFKGMSLKEVQPWSQGMITDEALAEIEAALAELG